MDLLLHTSDVKVDVLMPNKPLGYERPCICFSLNLFISFFGQYIYVFSKKTLEETFLVEKVPSSRVEMHIENHMNRTPINYMYQSEGLEWEFRAYKPIDVNLYGLGVITNFNYLKGVLERRISDKVTREMIDFSKGA